MKERERQIMEEAINALRQHPLKGWLLIYDPTQAAPSSEARAKFLKLSVVRISGLPDLLNFPLGATPIQIQNTCESLISQLDLLHGFSTFSFLDESNDAFEASLQAHFRAAYPNNGILNSGILPQTILCRDGNKEELIDLLKKKNRTLFDAAAAAASSETSR